MKTEVFVSQTTAVMRVSRSFIAFVVLCASLALSSCGDLYGSVEGSANGRRQWLGRIRNDGTMKTSCLYMGRVNERAKKKYNNEI